MKTIEITREDLNWAARRLPFAVKAMLQQHGSKLFVAGGYVRSIVAGERINDLDIFAATKDYAEACAKALANPEGRKPRKLIETDNAYTVVMNPFAVQFIHRWTFTEPVDAIESFDFTIAQATFWWDAGEKKWRGYAAERFYADLAAKRLVYTNPTREEAAGGSFVRVLKFYQRGYRIPLDSMGAVIAKLVSGIDFAKAENTTGVAAVITGLLHEVDPLIDPNHQAHLPSMTEEPPKAENEDEVPW